MKVVIDTNVILTAIFPRSKNHWIQKALENQQLILCLTTDILDEYAEVIESFYDAETAELFLAAIELLPNLQIHKYFFWQLIPADEDDEKFADCAIASGAEFFSHERQAFQPFEEIALS